MCLASIGKQRYAGGADDGGLKRGSVDATYSERTRPGGAIDKQGWIPYESSLCPPVPDVDFVGYGGAELVLDEYALNSLGCLEVVDERSRESRRDYGCDMQIGHDEAVIEMV